MHGSTDKWRFRCPSTPTFVHITHFPVVSNSPVDTDTSVQTRAQSFHDFGKASVGERTGRGYGPSSSDSCRFSRTSIFNGGREQQDFQQLSAANGAGQMDQHTIRDSFQSTLGMPCTVLADAKVERCEGSLKELDKSPVVCQEEMSHLHHRRSHSQQEPRGLAEQGDGGRVTACTLPIRRQSAEHTLQRMPVEIYRRLNKFSRDKCRREVIC